MRIGILSCAVALLAFAGIGQADIIGQSLMDDGDGAITCAAVWDAELMTWTVTGDQYEAPGHMVGSFTTDTELDPTVTLSTTIDNDTTFDWTGYTVNLYMNKTFLLSGVTATRPVAWALMAPTVVQPAADPGSFIDGDGNAWAFKGTIDFTGDPPVAIGGTLGFAYTMSFMGSVSYSQEMIPTPEPAMIGVLLAGAAAALLRRRRRR